MPNVYETGFVSKEQEEFLRQSNLSLYKAVIKKWGSYKPHKKQTKIRGME